MFHKDKIDKLLKVSGIDEKKSKILLKEIEKEFDPEEYDKDMKKAFDDNYYEEPDEEVPQEEESDLEVP